MVASGTASTLSINCDAICWADSVSVALPLRINTTGTRKCIDSLNQCSMFWASPGLAPTLYCCLETPWSPRLAHASCTTSVSRRLYPTCFAKSIMMPSKLENEFKSISSHWRYPPGPVHRFRLVSVSVLAEKQGSQCEAKGNSLLDYDCGTYSADQLGW